MTPNRKGTQIAELPLYDETASDQAVGGVTAHQTVDPYGI